MVGELHKVALSGIDKKQPGYMPAVTTARRPATLAKNINTDPAQQRTAHEPEFLFDDSTPPMAPTKYLNPQQPDGWTRAWPPRVLIMTVATHREPFIGLVEESVAQLGPDIRLHVAGDGEFFRGYGWKLKKMLETLLMFRGKYDLVIFTDSFDTYVLSSLEEIVRKFVQFNHSMVVSGEVNLWPNPNLKSELPLSCKTGHYRFPNSGGYMGYIDYIIDLYSEKIAIQHKSDCTDDQGELIKQLARDHTSFRIDHQAVIFQTLFGSAAADLQVQGARVFNKATGTRPCILHANGWDKGPLLELLKQTGRLTAAQQSELTATKASLEKKKILQSREQDINKRCQYHNPNPHLNPERNVIVEYGLLQKQSMLKERLKKRNVDWDTIEHQIYEVQEYLGYCPAPWPFTGRPVSDPHWSPRLNKQAYKLRQCNSENFKVYIYPRSQSQIDSSSKVRVATFTFVAYRFFDGSVKVNRACLFCLPNPIRYTMPLFRLWRIAPTLRPRRQR